MARTFDEKFGERAAVMIFFKGRNFSHHQEIPSPEPMTIELIYHTDKDAIHARIRTLQNEPIPVSDGEVTFDELRAHVARLWIALLKERVNSESAPVWRTRVGDDGTFLLGLNKLEGNQIVYKLPGNFWAETNFVPETLVTAPTHDGHTMEDIFARLANI